MKKIFLILSIFFSVFLICFGYFFGKRGAILDSNLEKKLSLLSVQKGGREMPLSSASSDVLRTIYGKASYEMPDGSHLSASEWIFYANANPLEVCNLKCFKTDNRELQNLLGLKGRYFSYNDFEKIVEKAYETAYAKEETLFVKACKDAIANIALFEDASTSFCFFFQDSSPLKTYLLWDNLVEEASSELKKSKEENRTPNHEKLMPMYEMLKLFEESFERFESRKTANIYAIKNDEAYTSAIAMIFDISARSESGVAYYKAMAQTLEYFAKKDFVAFEKNLEVLHIQNPSSKRVSFETLVMEYSLCLKLQPDQRLKVIQYVLQINSLPLFGEIIFLIPYFVVVVQ